LLAIKLLLAMPVIKPSVVVTRSPTLARRLQMLRALGSRILQAILRADPRLEASQDADVDVIPPTGLGIGVAFVQLTNGRAHLRLLD
jgi:hypothetical protein